MRKKKTHEEFILELETKNNDINVLEKYVDALTPIKFQCKIDGHIWKARPSSILYGQGCPICGVNKTKNILRKTHNDFIQELKSKNSNIEIRGKYVNSKTKILCRCKIDKNEWYALPSSLLIGQGCPVCGRKNIGKALRKDSEVFEKEFDNSVKNIKLLSKYHDANTKILCKCDICNHEWSVYPNSLLQGHGCPRCANNYKYDHCEFVNKVKVASNDEYEVIDKFVNTATKITFLHKKCMNKFKMTPNNFLSRGNRCPFCNESKGEQNIRHFLESINETFVPQKTFDGLVGVGNGLLSYDFYLPKRNLLIEYQGQFHDTHIKTKIENALEKQKEHDKRKREYAINNNIKLLEIWYKDFDNIEKILMEELYNGKQFCI